MVRQKRKAAKTRPKTSKEDENIVEKGQAHEDSEKTADSDIITENTDLIPVNRTVSDSEEDEAPQSISLSTSKDAALAQSHEQQEAIDLLKEKEKQRRRNKDEVLKRQKEVRQAREKSRIPDDILKKLAEKKESETELPVKDSEDATSNVHVTFDDDDDHSDADADEKEEQRGLQLMVLNQTNKKTRGVLDSANEFLNNHFYGDRLNRVETLKDQNLKRKSKYFGPAIKFSKTDT